MELQAVRGMHDLLGDEIAKWAYVEEKIHAIFSAFGYAESECRPSKKSRYFTHTVGDDTDIVQKQMYTLTDVSSEKLVLRPEGTASFIRAVIEHQLHRTGHPQRLLSTICPCSATSARRKAGLRQFHQFGGELINDPSPEADAELIILLDHVFRTFGLKEYEIRVNSVGCGDCRPQYKELLKDYFRPRLAELCEQCQKRFERSPMRILDCKREECRAVAKSAR